MTFLTRLTANRLAHCRLFSSYTLSDTSLTLHDISTAPFPFLWLRDACPTSPASIHPSTRQKLFRTSDIPLDIKPSLDGVLVSPSGLSITWSDGHKSFYTPSFLARYASPAALSSFHKDIAQTPWALNDTASGKMPDLFLPYASISTDAGLMRAITQLAQYGLLFVQGVPNEETDNATCELRTLGERFGELRRTFYGETWDVVNLKDSKNIAYTNLDLGMHMDLLYFRHPPRYQILHCLRNRVEGGTSLFVDALHAASTLRKTYPDEFDILSSSPVGFHYINDGHHMHCEHPTIELGTPPSPGAPAPIAHINYSPPFQAPLPLSTPTVFFQALQRFVGVLSEENRQYAYTLTEGDAVLFDNRRVLHARTSFHEKEDNSGGGPNRWLKGCYLEADAIMDRGRIIRGKL